VCGWARGDASPQMRKVLVLAMWGVVGDSFPLLTRDDCDPPPRSHSRFPRPSACPASWLHQVSAMVRSLESSFKSIKILINETPSAQTDNGSIYLPHYAAAAAAASE
jgi:hypothetical protein